MKKKKKSNYEDRLKPMSPIKIKEELPKIFYSTVVAYEETLKKK